MNQVSNQNVTVGWRGQSMINPTFITEIVQQLGLKKIDSEVVRRLGWLQWLDLQQARIRWKSFAGSTAVLLVSYASMKEQEASSFSRDLKRLMGISPIDKCDPGDV